MTDMEKHADEELRNISDSEVLAIAQNLMDEFDEAFKELAK